MSDSKYRMFRNFMVNELGIGRDDIKEWTMQAVKEAVEKEMRGVDVEKVACDLARQQLQGVYDYNYQRQMVNEAIGDAVRKSLVISVGLREIV